jgi:hypothetical protein
MNSRHLGEVDKLHFALHCLLFTLHFLLRTALKQHPSWCHVFKDVDDLTVVYLNVSFNGKQEKVREPILVSFL